MVRQITRFGYKVCTRNVSNNPANLGFVVIESWIIMMRMDTALEQIK